MTRPVFLFKKWISLPIFFFSNSIINLVQNERREGSQEKSDHLIIGSGLLCIKHPMMFIGKKHCSKCLKYINSFNPQDKSTR